MKNTSELEFENLVIKYLTQIGGVKQWIYEPTIKSEDDLWENFKLIVESNNKTKINDKLSDTEFNQIKNEISSLNTPFKAGTFLYGINGVSQIDIQMDDGRTEYFTIFDQDQVGAGGTSYQVVNQIKKDSVIKGRQNRRFDVTLLINGLPLIQIELKKAHVNVNDSVNQFYNYISDNQYSGIFSTLQILVAMSPYEIKYLANTTREQFNKAFVFQWQDEATAAPIRDWKKFCDLVLSIPMAHDLATRYMILDGTKNKECIKVMRPYQVYATKSVLNKVKKFDFKPQDNKMGYIWHTTGSGKTITSFKTAWLASRLPKVDKVIFLVDRIALTNQTVEAYQAYDPHGTHSSNNGVVSETTSIRDLAMKFKMKTDKNIIVTSIQKMSGFAESKYFNLKDQNILFIVDEAHRSTGSSGNEEGMMDKIRSAIPTAGWVGYTGTPNFRQKDVNRTDYRFGPLLHAYTIKEAIADKNVLGFKVEFKETIEAPIDPSDEDYDNSVKSTVYDESDEHIRIVVEDILTNWNSRSSNRRYNAMLTVNVGGQKTSSPRVMDYFKEFKKQNSMLPEAKRIKVGASFSMVSSNTSYQVESNENLEVIINDYNLMFGTTYDLTTVKEYTDDLASRLNKTSMDRKYLDLVIVINQFLTGFDAPELNTLYIDRTLKGSGLIQAYSRTNRIKDFTYKPYGNIVNYRWPIKNEYEMNKAFAIYSNRESAVEQLSLEELIASNIADGLLAEEYPVLLNAFKDIINDIRELTDGFLDIPKSEREQEELFSKLQEYNSTLNKLRQYPYDNKNNIGFPDNIEEFYSTVGISEEEESLILTGILNDLKDRIAEDKGIDISDITLKLEHIQAVLINYDYLIDLIAEMADYIYSGSPDKAEALRKDFNIEVGKVESEKERRRFISFVSKIFNSEFKFKYYPVNRSVDEVVEAMKLSEEIENSNAIQEFIDKFGISGITNISHLNKIIRKHRIGKQDLDNRNEITSLMNKAKNIYPMTAVSEISKLTWIKYRNTFKKDIHKLADKIKENES